MLVHRAQRNESLFVMPQQRLFMPWSEPFLPRRIQEKSLGKEKNLPNEYLEHILVKDEMSRGG